MIATRLIRKGAGLCLAHLGSCRGMLCLPVFSFLSFLALGAGSAFGGDDSADGGGGLGADGATKVYLEPGPLYNKSYEEIFRNYVFINDFTVKRPDRPISPGLFWSYPYPSPKIRFPIFPVTPSDADDVPATESTGRPIEHINKGRVSFLEGRVDEARKIFLAARQRYGEKYDHHRRNDYFIGISYLYQAEQARKKYKSFDHDEVRPLYVTATTFLSWSLVRKSHLPDPVVDRLTPRMLYNLSAIYHTYGKYASAYGAATAGMNWLRAQGLKQWRADFRAISAEILIKNRNYLSAVQEFDTIIQGSRLDKAKVSAAFARAGDVYFDLNNYELAEDAYGISLAINRFSGVTDPVRMILRGESLFWLGRFSDAQKMLDYGLETSNHSSVLIDNIKHLIPWAKLRVADAYLARFEELSGRQGGTAVEVDPKYSGEQKDLLDQAALAYFRVASEFPNTEAARVAKIRSACLELPFYQGNNVRHARSTLDAFIDPKKSGKSPAAESVSGEAIELAWACRAASYASRDRDEKMLGRVRKFRDKYPRSRFLEGIAPSVKAYQASKLQRYLKEGKKRLAISYFEKNRKLLFRKIDGKTAANLFRTYVDTFSSKKANEFYSAFDSQEKTALDRLRELTFLAERKKPKKGKLGKLRQNLGEGDLPYSPLARDLVSRILVSSAGPHHLRWAEKLAANWSKSNRALKCSLHVPILSRLIMGEGKKHTEQTTMGILAVASEALPSILTDNPQCGSSIIDLETEVLTSNLRKNGKTYAKRWLDRRSWKVDSVVARAIWGASETLYSAGRRRDARLLWEHLASKAPAASPEGRLAKLRLDASKTEYENIWQ